MLVEVTSVDQLIDRLRKGKYRSKAEVLADSKRPLCPGWFTSLLFLVRRANIDDDEIVAGHQKMSLKCPVSTHNSTHSTARADVYLVELYAYCNTVPVLV